jgi:hypothetical protein
MVVHISRGNSDPGTIMDSEKEKEHEACIPYFDIAFNTGCIWH